MQHTAPSAPKAPHPPRARLARGALALVLALALSAGVGATTGCMVMDELDGAAAKMPTTAKEKAAKAGKGDAGAKAPSAAERLAAAKAAARQRSEQWWKEAKSMTPGEKSAEIARCALPEGTRYMAKSDCAAAGGRLVDGAS
jgi:hypothetical protein